jgi:hypothetical protein
VDVAVSFLPASTRVQFAWTLKVFDRCTGASADGGSGGYAAPRGWNRVVVTTPVSIPAEARNAAIVAVTTAPEVAASAPVELAPPAC